MTSEEIKKMPDKSTKERIKKGNPKRITKKPRVIALRMGECDVSHRSMDMVIEVLSWELPIFRREIRQSLWNEKLNKFPEIQKYIGETEETNHPVDAPEEILLEIGKFITEKEDIYESVIVDKYKILPNGKTETPLLVMKGINVNPGPENRDLVYNSEVGAIVEGEIIGYNTWGDDIMINHRVLFKFDPQDPKDVLECIIRYGDEFLGWWNLEHTREWYNREFDGFFYNACEDSPADEFIEKIIEEIKQEELPFFRFG